MEARGRFPIYPSGSVNCWRSGQQEADTIGRGQTDRSTPGGCNGQVQVSLDCFIGFPLEVVYLLDKQGWVLELNAAGFRVGIYLRRLVKRVRELRF